MIIVDGGGRATGEILHRNPGGAKKSLPPRATSSSPLTRRGLVSEETVARMGNRMPEYPGVAVEAGWQGTVVLSLLLGSSGEVERVRVAESSGYRVLDGAAEVAARSWKIKDRKGEVTVPIRFVIE
ncbi:MAG: energy transducer TonB [Deltaproteobacteria bacterium]|nr:energy transducer TonB [Deltaproteobacteria bacterium]MBI3295115.1 energy transducer TonB [Deltaproteobacteria bacterium]